MWNENGSSYICSALLKVCQRELNVHHFSVLYTCIRATARGTDFNRIWRTTFSEVENDLLPVDVDHSVTVNDKGQLGGGEGKNENERENGEGEWKKEDSVWHEKRETHNTINQDGKYIRKLMSAYTPN